MTDNTGVCIVTQPERGKSGKDHAHDLADIIGYLTSVVLLTANVPSGSDLAEHHEVVEYSSQGTGETVIVEALRFVRNQIRLCLALQEREESVVLFFGTTSYVLPVLWARLSGKKVLILPRGDVPLSLRLRWEESFPTVIARTLAGLVSSLERVSYRLADAVVAYTPEMAQQLGLDRYEEKLYPNGARFIDTEQFDVRVPFEERERAVGFLGRLDVEKRIPELVSAAKQLPDDIRFVFVGDGDYRDRLESELAGEIENGNVEITGWVERDEVPEQLNRLQLLVVPSHPTEGLPTAILESMACGTPAYATPVSGVPDVVREDDTGFLMEEVDGNIIASEIEQILAMDELEEISRNSRKLITTEYSFAGAVDRWRDILTAVSSIDCSSA
jgi:glycosyltransferase involved in cell wall biosynthesis